MNEFLKAYLVENFGLAADADEAAAKSLASEKLDSKELDLDKYTELLTKKAEEPPKDKGDELAEKIVKGLTPVLEALKPQPAEAPKTEDPKPEEIKEPTSEELTEKLMERVKKEFGLDTPKGNGTDAEKIWKMAIDDENDKHAIRVKSRVERWSHTPTAVVHSGKAAKILGVEGKPILVNGQEVHHLTERTKWLSAVWAKFQLAPEYLNEWETECIQWILHKEKFNTPWRSNGMSDYLTEDERHKVLNANLNFYKDSFRKALIDDTTSGGEEAVPEFFDMDFITTPTLASENIPSYCNVISVPRGSAAQNFTMGRPTIAAANTEGSATAVFTTTGFIAAHDTSFFRAAGFMEIGRNFLEDAHPGVLMEVYNQYMNSVLLWLNEQIMVGDGTTEPQGVTVDTGTGDITPANPTTGAITLADVLNMLFGVGKAFRNDGGSRNAIYCMTDTTYKLIRSIATGVTGDTRLVFGQDVESYELFGHPVLIEEEGLANSDAVFFQAKGYRLYQRQGARMIREDRGDTMVRQNTILAGVDIRYGGQLDLPGYAAVVDAFPA